MACGDCRHSGTAVWMVLACCGALDDERCVCVRLVVLLRPLRAPELAWCRLFAVNAGLCSLSCVQNMALVMGAGGGVNGRCTCGFAYGVGNPVRASDTSTSREDGERKCGDGVCSKVRQERERKCSVLTARECEAATMAEVLRHLHARRGGPWLGGSCTFEGRAQADPRCSNAAAGSAGRGGEGEEALDGAHVGDADVRLAPEHVLCLRVGVARRPLQSG